MPGEGRERGRRGVGEGRGCQGRGGSTPAGAGGLEQALCETGVGFHLGRKATVMLLQTRRSHS